MLLSLLQGPDDPAVITLAEAKEHARVEVSEDDLLIQGYVQTARDFAEWYTQRAFGVQQWAMHLDGFPAERWFEVPKPPLLSVEGITYLDGHGEEQVLAAEAYRVVAPAGPRAAPGRVLLRAGWSWPATLREAAAVTVTFTCGYEDAGVPQAIKDAIKVHVAELYENRESTVLTGATLQEVPFSVKTLLWPFRVDKV